MAPPQLVSWPTQLANRATPILPGLTGMTPEPCMALRKAWCSVPAFTWSPHSQGLAVPLLGQAQGLRPSQARLSCLVSADYGAASASTPRGTGWAFARASRIPTVSPTVTTVR